MSRLRSSVATLKLFERAEVSVNKFFYDSKQSIDDIFLQYSYNQDAHRTNNVLQAEADEEVERSKRWSSRSGNQSYLTMRWSTTIAEKAAQGQVEGRSEADFFEGAPDAGNDIQSFYQMNLSWPPMKAIGVLGYVHLTPIQTATIPIPGTGKTVS